MSFIVGDSSCETPQLLNSRGFVRVRPCATSFSVTRDTTTSPFPLLTDAVPRVSGTSGAFAYHMLQTFVLDVADAGRGAHTTLDPRFLSQMIIYHINHMLQTFVVDVADASRGAHTTLDPRFLS